MMTTEVSNSADILDSRDIIARIEELETDEEDREENRVALVAVRSETDDEGWGLRKAATASYQQARLNFTDEAKAELKALRDLAEEAEGSPDWEHGEALIRDTYFKEYAQETAEDCGMIRADDRWPQSCIDWDQAADELKQDYTSVEFDGVDYWIRS